MHGVPRCLTGLIVMIMSQCIYVYQHQVVYLLYIIFIYQFYFNKFYLKNHIIFIISNGLEHFFQDKLEKKKVIKHEYSLLQSCETRNVDLHMKVN